MMPRHLNAYSFDIWSIGAWNLLMAVIMYLMPDLEERKESEIPSRHEDGSMDNVFVLYLRHKPGWAYHREEKEEKMYPKRISWEGLLAAHLPHDMLAACSSA